MSKRKMSLRELDFNNAGAWPRNYQIGACVLLGLVIALLLWWLFTRDKGDTLEGLEHQEADLRSQYETKVGRAENLGPLKQQMAQMEQQLRQMLRQLPSKADMPDLIQDISQTAIATGIQNELFQPGPETPKEFYAEKPIQLRMVGTYHQFGAFVSGVAALPRVVILTMHDINLSPKDPTAGIKPNEALVLAGTVKTYRYLDEEETAEQEKAADGAKAGTAPNGGGK